ncbi:Rho GTPase-activating protein 11A [Collichthys lucidus]|uniref:Rho GTPase-activating protein 11A n=1 Tax=Collichthys lucidus TaxID=240159 RepID=A0A4V6ASY7_COLLU|nr:Rho GTPase-activating protein 11A [Collichthys lucidus]
MKVMERNVMRLAAVQHLRTAYGIKTKNWNKNKTSSCKTTASNSAKLDAGEECLSSALPCDVAGLVKQFFRELPEPVLPAELQEALLKAQQLPTEEERTAATMLLSCVIPDRNLTALRHFFDFLHTVSKRSAENKMDSSNLSVILAPNLLHFGDCTEKMNANTEKRLKLQAAIIHCFIENAHTFGVLPQFLREKVPAMMGSEAGILSPTHDELEELDLNSGMKKRHRRSFGDVVSGALNKIKTNRTPTNATQSDSLGRVESGKAGCFSPKVSKKEAPRKSLRLRFSLGKSSKDAGSESIGWRLATQESTTSFRFTKETEFSPSGLPRKAESKSSNYISKSEDNLLTPQCNSSAHRTSWSGETPVGAQAFSGGSFTDTPMNMRLKSNYIAESLESERSISEVQSRAGPTLLNIKTGFTESGSVSQEPCNTSVANATNPPDSIFLPPPETPTVKVLSVDTEASSIPTQQSLLAKEQNITFGQIEIAALTPLHIDSHNSRVEESEREVEQVNCSRLIDALDIQSPALFKPGVCSGLQSTPRKLELEFENELDTPPKIGTMVTAVHEKSDFSPEIGSKVPNKQTLSPCSLETEKRRVVDHIQHFNKLTLHSPRGSKASLIRSPLKFQRTPVRQTVRRINSLLGENRRPTRNAKFTSSQSGQVLKAGEPGERPLPSPTASASPRRRTTGTVRQHLSHKETASGPTQKAEHLGP